MPILLLGICACSESETESAGISFESDIEVSAPPPIQGGTLLVTSTDRAVVSDPDRSEIQIVDLPSGRLIASTEVENGAEPGRAVEDAQGFVHVTLRRSGEVLRVGQNAGVIASSRWVCPSPSGITYDEVEDLLYVVCTTGEVIALPSSDGPPREVARLEPDLRDIVLHEDRFFISQFRSAMVIQLNRRFSEVYRWRSWPVSFSGAPFASYIARVAWAMKKVEGHGVVLLHQLVGTELESHVPSGSWDGGPPSQGECARPVLTGLSVVGTSQMDDYWGLPMQPLGGTLVTDFATTRDGSKIAFASTGDSLTDGGADVFAGEMRFDYPACTMAEHPVAWSGDYEITAVGFDSGGRLLAQSRNPGVLIRDASFGDSRVTELSSWNREDAGHHFFHVKTDSGVACASCHPAGLDDGHVWAFTGEVRRRTMSLAGTLEGTAPFHWEGDMTDLGMILDDVFRDVMHGPELLEADRTAFSEYLLAIPPPARRPMGELAETGRLIFESPDVGCGTCHSGDKLTNNETVDVGTGAALQVPSLIGMSVRPPYMADGCARTIEERFDPSCGGDDHGNVGHLSDGDRIALMAYLESL